MKRLSLKEIQQAEFEILRCFRALCEENGLYYTLAGGTLLGAVRHKGFIPWDDDIDVLMPRPDFDRLLKGENIRTDCLPSYIEISSWRSPDGEPFPFIKILDTRICVSDRFSHADRHLWIDIFPMDGCTGDDDQLRHYYRRVMFFRHLLLLRSAKIGEGKSLLKRIFKPLLILPLRLLSAKWICEQYNRLCKRYDFDASDYAAGITWGYGPRERIDKKKYLEPVELLFESDRFAAPSNYDEYLTGLYHDYMQLPPEDQRVTRHETVVYRKDDES